jgi:hypothetical protein
MYSLLYVLEPDTATKLIRNMENAARACRGIFDLAPVWILNM